MNKTKKDLGNVRHDFAASPERGSGKANHVADVGGLLGKIYEMAKEIKKETAKLCNMSYCEDCTLYQNDICLAVKAEYLLQDIEEYLGEEYNEN